MITCVYYYDEPKQDDLILDAVCPLLDGSGYFVRHWKGGPHVRIAGADLASVERVVGDYLLAHPSTVELDEAEVLRAHAKRAALEGDEPAPLAGDNTIRASLGVTHPLIAAFHAASHPMVVTALTAIRSGADRLAVGISLLFAAVEVISANGAAGFVALRSHGDAFLAQCGARPDFERQYARNRATLLRRLAAVREQDTMAEWSGLLSEYRGQAASVELSEVGPAPAWAGSSPLHSLIWSSDSYLRMMRENRTFAADRVVLNLCYEVLARLGLAPYQRYLLCHLAAGTYEEIEGVTALDLVSRRL